MYKLWGKKIKDHKITASIDVYNNMNITQDAKRDICINEICDKLDISVPVWLKKHNIEFTEYFKVTFYPEDFIDEIDFDRLEIEVIDDGSLKK